jgi:CheY-like chemotaxis protein
MPRPDRVPVLLLVEDSDDDAYFFQRTLNQLGKPHELTRLHDGRTAVNFLQRLQTGTVAGFERPDLIFLDLKLPSFTGFDLLEWLTDNQSDLKVPIVVLSGSDHPSDVARAAALRAERYLVKPVTRQQLEDLLSEHGPGAPLGTSP